MLPCKCMNLNIINLRAIWVIVNWENWRATPSNVTYIPKKMRKNTQNRTKSYLKPPILFFQYLTNYISHRTYYQCSSYRFLFESDLHLFLIPIIWYVKIRFRVLLVLRRSMDSTRLAPFGCLICLPSLWRV